jgi:hypothetical protein
LHRDTLTTTYGDLTKDLSCKRLIGVSRFFFLIKAESLDLFCWGVNPLQFLMYHNMTKGFLQTSNRLYCGGDKPVRVRAYYRVRLGRLEFVRSHCRAYPNAHRRAA